MDRNIKLLFDRMEDALLLVSGVGKVLYANPAAQAILPATMEDPASIDWLHRQILSVQRGYLQTPHSFDIDLCREPGVTDQIRVTLLLSPSRHNFIVLARSVTTDRFLDNEITNFTEILLDEIRGPIRHFLGSLATMLVEVNRVTHDLPALEKQVATVTRFGNLLEERLKKVSVLAASTRAFTIHGNDRITLTFLIEEALQTVRHWYDARRIQVSYCGLRESLPVIYGSKPFLVQALAGYLRYLAERLREGTNILISAQITGTNVTLTLTNFGNLLPSVARNSNRSEVAALNHSETSFAELTLALCKRVIRLTGGKVHFERENKITKAIAIELPIGSPTSKTRDLDMQQTLRYAQDLNTLMQITPRHFGESPDENIG